jgi:hypothetical protein
MAWHGAILDVGRPFANRDGIQDLAGPRTPSSARAGVPKVMLTAQMLNQATFKDAATLHEQTAIDRFGRHLHVSIARKGVPKPAGDLLGRPLLRQLLRHDTSECRPGGQATGLRTTAAPPRLTVSDRRSIDAAATVARYFSADR